MTQSRTLERRYRNGVILVTVSTVVLAASALATTGMPGSLIGGWLAEFGFGRVTDNTNQRFQALYVATSEGWWAATEAYEALIDERVGTDAQAFDDAIVVEVTFESWRSWSGTWAPVERKVSAHVLAEPYHIDEYLDADYASATARVVSQFRDEILDHLRIESGLLDLAVKNTTASQTSWEPRHIVLNAVSGLSAAIMVLGGLLVLRTRRQLVWEAAGGCAGCGYPLEGAAGTCPECGSAPD